MKTGITVSVGGHLGVYDEDEEVKALYPNDMPNPETPETDTEKELKKQRRYNEDVEPLYPIGVDPE